MKWRSTVEITKNKEAFTSSKVSSRIVVLSILALCCTRLNTPITQSPNSTGTVHNRSILPAPQQASMPVVAPKRGEWLDYVHLAWRLGPEVHLVDPKTFRTFATLKTSDGSRAACLTRAGDGSLLLLSQSGQLSVWDERGRLTAVSDKLVGPSDDCVTGRPDAFDVAWDPQRTRFVTISRDLAQAFLGVWLWTSNGTSLEPRRILEGNGWTAGFLLSQDGLWANRLGAKEFHLVSLDHEEIKSYGGDVFALSPDETQLVVSTIEPRQKAKLVNLKTGRPIWETTGNDIMGWSPSMNWLTGNQGNQSAVFSAITGKLLARWESSGLGCGAQTRWLKDLLIDADGDRITFWRPGKMPSTYQLNCDGGGSATDSHNGRYTLSLNTIWSLEADSIVRHLEVTNSENSPAFGAMADYWSADDQFISGGLSEAMVIWNASSGEQVSVLPGLGDRTSNWDSTGHRLFIASPHELVIHDPMDQWTLVLFPETSNDTVRYKLVRSEGCDISLLGSNIKISESCRQLALQLREVNGES